MDTLAKLQDWYLAQCNEVWEHTYGIDISNCDNPGWLVKIDLVDTDLYGKSFNTVKYGLLEDDHASDNEWVHCMVEDGQFRGAGGPEKLEELLHVFLRWAGAT